MKYFVALILVLLCPPIAFCQTLSSVDNVYDMGQLTTGLLTVSYGAKCDGVTDDTAAFTEGNAALATTGGNLIVPSGSICVVHAASTSPKVNLVFRGGGRLSVPSPYTLTVNGPMEGPLAQRFTGSGAVVISSAGVDGIYPQWWQDGDEDWTASIQNAVNSGNGRPVSVRMPAHTYTITGTITISNNRVKILGDGQQLSIVSFNPSIANKTAFSFTAGASVIVQCGVSGMTFDATGNMQSGKVAVSISDSDIFILHDNAVSNWSDRGGNSIGFQFRGRDFNDVSDNTVYADIPISIEPNPNSTLSSDHYTFSGFNFLGGNSEQPCVRVADNTSLSNFTMSGTNSWVLCKYGFYWNDPSTTIESLSVLIENFRHEQYSDATGYTVYINHGDVINNLMIRNGRSGTGPVDINGYYLRHTLNSTLSNLFYSGALVAIDIDATNQSIDLQQVHVNNPSATVRVSSTALSGTHALEGIYTTPRSVASATSKDITYLFNPSKAMGLSQLESLPVSVAAKADIKLLNDTQNGILFIEVNGAGHGMVWLIGSLHLTFLGPDPTGQWGTMAGAANFNVYWDVGSSSYKLQNNTAETTMFKMVLVVFGDR